MYSIIHSGAINGLQSYVADVEVNVSAGLPSFDLVGKLSGEVKEAKERVRVAILNCGLSLPPIKITVNISPANIQKHGTAFDLPIAIGILNALDMVPIDLLNDTLIIGELGLDGQIKRANGVLPIIIAAKNAGLKYCIVPYENAKEAQYVGGITVYPAYSFLQVIDILNGLPYEADDDCEAADCLFSSKITDVPDFADIIGQEACKRAALIAASGFHHLLITGPPGAGKTMIARRIAGIMPPLTESESLEVSTIYSIAGLLSDKCPFIDTRPFQAPHHTTTKQTLAGGGSKLRPGTISLSHRGVLFLDEFPEFSRECIEVLREPLEDKHIQISRVTNTFTYPADFMLVAAANPCPCGFFPNRSLCNCSEPMIARYRNKISGPMKDRIDIIVAAEAVDAEQLIKSSNASKLSDNSDGNYLYTSDYMRSLVLKARGLQDKRFKGTDFTYNSDITPGKIADFCHLGAAECEYMRDIYETMDLSARSYHKILKVARTIADLDESNNIGIPHLAEAICYRG